MKNETHLTAQIEGLLFVSGEPLSLARLAKALSREEEAILEALTLLKERYQEEHSGLTLILHENTVKLATKPALAPWVEELTKSTMQESLSRAALEVLAIIAYKAPITRAEIESIRGVNCTFTLRNLLLRGLIERSGNPEDARGYVYRPAFRFLETLGLSRVSELPDYQALSQDAHLTPLEDKESSELSREIV